MPIDEQVRKAIVASILKADPTIKLTWDKIVTMSRDLGIPRTRQWLCKDESIKKAYVDHKQGGPFSGPMHSSVGLEQNESNEKSDRVELERLKKLIEDYDKRFIRWLANATAHGLTLGQLDAPHYILDDHSMCEGLNRPAHSS